MRYIYFLLFILCACKGPAPKQEESKDTDLYSAVVIDNPDSTFGYEIYNDSVMVIRQVNIPALPGNRGFGNREEAGEIAGFVIHKLKAGIMPPTVTPEEIDSVLKAK